MSAKDSTAAKSPFVPRPPETTTDASVSSGRPPLTGGCEDEIEDFFAASEIVTATLSLVALDELRSASTEFGRSVMTAVP